MEFYDTRPEGWVEDIALAEFEARRQVRFEEVVNSSPFPTYTKSDFMYFWPRMGAAQSWGRLIRTKERNPDLPMQFISITEEESVLQGDIREALAWLKSNGQSNTVVTKIFERIIKDEDSNPNR
ncbi:MAG TPA: hypothetical protein VMR76_03675 [Candidatus Saccharimonadia bacterium]|nr:hypothetical protein [Candidatus Saccharimonadia bacterium]